MEDFCERPRKLIHKELLRQDFDTLTYKDRRNISRNMHKARSSQLLPLPTKCKQVRKSYFCLLMTRKKKILKCFLAKPTGRVS